MLWDRRAEMPLALPVVAAHDELVLECDDAEADAMATWLRTALLDALTPLLDPVPAEVTVRTALT